MRSILTTVLCLVGLGLGAQDIDYSSLTIPAHLKENAHSVVRHWEMRYEVKSDRQARLYFHKVVTLLDGDHGDENQLVATYQSNSKITKFKATMYDALGNDLGATRRADIEDVSAVDGNTFDSDMRIQTATLPIAQYPCTIEFIYEMKLSDFAMVAWMPNFLPVVYSQSCQNALLEISVPADNQVYHWSNEIAKYAETTREGVRVYNWSLTDYPATPAEPYAPAYTRVLPFVETTLDQFTINGHAGSLASWDEWGKFKYQLYQDRQELPEALRKEVHKLVDGLTTNAEKIAALYRFMQERMRYVSVQLDVGGWQPFTAAEVEANRWGDCKALSNYLCALLKEVGISSELVNITRGENYFPVEEDFASASFNHIMLYVPEQDLYLECTSKDFPVGYLDESTIDRNVVHFSEAGGRVGRTPKRNASDNGRLRRLSVKMDEQGKADLALTVDYYGERQELYRQLATHTPDRAEQLRLLHRWGDIPDVKGSAYELDVRADEALATLSYTTSLEDYSRARGSRLFVELNKFSDVIIIPDKDTNRVHPIVQKANAFYIDSVYLSLPEGMEIESLGDAEINYTHAAGEYRSKVEVSGNDLVWSRTLKLEPVELPASEWESFREFYLNVSQAEGRRVVLKERRSR